MESTETEAGQRRVGAASQAMTFQRFAIPNSCVSVGAKPGGDFGVPVDDDLLSHALAAAVVN